MAVIGGRRFRVERCEEAHREYAAPGGVSPTMTLPTVTEIRRRPEATTRDTFIADLFRPAGRGPRPTP